MKTIIFTLVSLFATVAFAKTYGNAGCGLGSLVLGSNGNQILAATTNGTSGSQTFGITSGTSNCTEGGMAKSAMQVPLFIEINRMSLAKDAARGEGETLAGLAQLMGCKADTFGPAMKSHYKQIFVDTEMHPAGIESGINSMISADKAHACGA